MMVYGVVFLSRRKGIMRSISKQTNLLVDHNISGIGARSADSRCNRGRVGLDDDTS